MFSAAERPHALACLCRNPGFCVDLGQLFRERPADFHFRQVVKEDIRVSLVSLFAGSVMGGQVGDSGAFFPPEAAATLWGS